MADNFDENTQRAKITAGYKGGPFFQRPMLHPSMSIVDAVPPEVSAKLMAKSIPSIPMVDPWGGKK